MVEYNSNSLDLSFYALSDPTRRAILARIVKEDLTVGELADPFEMSLAAVSKHLQVLERARFIKKTKVGRVITCKATLEPLGEMKQLLEELGSYWNNQLDSLERYLAGNLDRTGIVTNKTKNEKRNGKAKATSTGRKATSKRQKR